MIGRRVETLDEIKKAGDYCLIEGYTGDKPAVMFLLPTASDDDARRVDPEHPANGLHHVTSPPHDFRECEDGSVEVFPSIGAYGPNPDAGYIWHGYLTKGHDWREA